MIADGARTCGPRSAGAPVFLACPTRKNRASARASRRESRGAVTVLSLGRACKKNRRPALLRCTSSMSSILAIETLRPVVARIRTHDRDLGEQLRTALSSVALNLAEGERSQGGNRLARFSTAAGSNAESRAALRVAVAWGYVEAQHVGAGMRSSIAWRPCCIGWGRGGECARGVPSATPRPCATLSA